jgi:hypothetical protein
VASHYRMSVEYGLSAFYGNAYLLQAAQHLWHASVARKQTYRLPEHELMATLFAALASEAYINTALDLMLGRDDAKGLSWAAATGALAERPPTDFRAPRRRSARALIGRPRRGLN